MAAPRGPTRHLRGVSIYIYILDILYSMGFQPSVYRKGFQTLITAAPYKHVSFSKLLRVGLKPLISGKIDRWIEVRDASHVDMVNEKSTTTSITHVSFKKNYNGQI